MLTASGVGAVAVGNADGNFVHAMGGVTAANGSIAAVVDGYASSAGGAVIEGHGTASLGAQGVQVHGVEGGPASTADTAVGGVYLLVDDKGNVVRTGRTNNFTRREAEHKRDPVLKDYEFERVYRTDNFVEQRGLEQYAHELYDPPLDKINPIGARDPNAGSYQKAAWDYLLAEGHL